MFCLFLATFPRYFVKTIFFAMCHDWTLCSIMSVDRDFHKCLEPRRINNPPPNLCRLDLSWMLLQPWPGHLGLYFIFCLCRAQGSTRFVSLGPWEIFSVYASGPGHALCSPNTLIHASVLQSLIPSTIFLLSPLPPSYLNYLQGHVIRTGCQEIASWVPFDSIYFILKITVNIHIFVS